MGGGREIGEWILIGTCAWPARSRSASTLFSLRLGQLARNFSPISGHVNRRWARPLVGATNCVWVQSGELGRPGLAGESGDVGYMCSQLLFSLSLLRVSPTSSHTIAEQSASESRYGGMTGCSNQSSRALRLAGNNQTRPKTKQKDLSRLCVRLDHASTPSQPLPHSLVALSTVYSFHSVL